MLLALALASVAATQTPALTNPWREWQGMKREAEKARQAEFEAEVLRIVAEHPELGRGWIADALADYRTHGGTGILALVGFLVREVRKRRKPERKQAKRRAKKKSKKT